MFKNIAHYFVKTLHSTENRIPLFAEVASFNPFVVGSTPAGPTKIFSISMRVLRALKPIFLDWLFCFLHRCNCGCKTHFFVRMQFRKPTLKTTVLETSVLRLGFLIFWFVLVTGCATVDRLQLSRLEPLKVEESFVLFTFTANSPVGYSSDITSDDEKVRMGWLEWHLEKNGFNRSGYLITSRETLVVGDGVIGKSYKIFYTIKVPKATSGLSKSLKLD
jgi:hypothetical protein